MKRSILSFQINSKAMKKFLFLLTLWFTGSLAAQTTISGCIENAPDTLTTLKVAYLRGKNLAVKQEIPVVNGCFEAAKSFDEEGIFIMYLDPTHSFDLVLSDSDVQLSIPYENIQATKRIGNGNDEFEAFKSLLGSSPNEESIREFLLGIKDDALREFLLPQLLPLNPDTNVYWLRKHFWEYTNLESKSTLINPFFEKNRNMYFDQVLGHHPDTVIYHLATLLNQPMDPQVKKVLVSTATYHYETSQYMGEDKVFVWLARTFYNSGFADWMSKDDLAKIKEKSDGLSTEIIGEKARDFAFDTKGGRMKLSDVEAKVIILYFWDSTCGHCKKETPRMKKLYDDYKDKGVEVVALTLENEFTNWEKYINEKELDWINGYESDFDRPNFLWYYYIPSTPKKLILNGDLEIIAKNLDVETTLRTFLDDYLSGKVK